MCGCATALVIEQRPSDLLRDVSVLGRALHRNFVNRSMVLAGW